MEGQKAWRVLRGVRDASPAAANAHPSADDNHQQQHLSADMLASRIEPKRQARIDPKKKHFAEERFNKQSYSNRLNFYSTPPTENITIEEFEEWAIHRLKVLAELEACTFRNKTHDETEAYMRPILEKYLPLHNNSARGALRDERRKDHYSHFVLRLAFSATEDLRSRFSRLESQLFRLRFSETDVRDRQEFVESLKFDWEKVTDAERLELKDQLHAVSPKKRDEEDLGFFKVAWTQVPELVERRQVYLRAGMAYVPAREQTSMVVSEFTRHLDRALEQTARHLPRLDEDDRLSPILAHLSQNFATPGSAYSEDASTLPGTAITAGSIDSLSGHFPLCMRNLHTQLRKNNHLKHFGRLQYTLFLKGIGLSLDECLLFWRSSFKAHTDDQFNKEYRYNIRHAYGDVGGDSNRRGRGYTPYSCQKLLTEPAPGPGQSHGCPYRTHTPDNLVGLLQGMGVNDQSLLRGVKEDVGKTRYHIACNRVFEWAHKGELKKVKDEGLWKAEDLDTIVHPNVYFKRSWLLKNLGKAGAEDGPKREVTIDR